MTEHTETFGHEVRISELEREVAALKAAVFPKSEPAARPYIERGVSITHPVRPPSDPPTAEEFDRLLALVREKFPVFKRPESASDANEARYRRSFAKGFRFVCQAFKRTEPNSSVSGDWWCGEAAEFLRSVGADRGEFARIIESDFITILRRSSMY